MAGRRNVAGNTSRTALIKNCTLALILFLFTLNQCSKSLLHNQVPQPILPEYPGIESMYWKVWEILSAHTVNDTRANGFVRRYINCESDLYIQQAPTIYTALFGMYGNDCLPVMASLDNFYRGQRADGHIARVYNLFNGEPLKIPSVTEPMIHPPLFTWAEWRYYRLTDDRRRLKEFFPVWERYFQWLENFCQGKGETAELYYNTPLGANMPNSPRGNNELGGWIDLSSQIALSAYQLAQIAVVLDKPAEALKYRSAYQQIAEKIRTNLWNVDEGLFFDKTRDGRFIKIKTTAGFWPLLAKVPDLEAARIMIDHLKDAGEFDRHHRFPSLAAKEGEFSPTGAYWRGGVWGNENFMLVQGLKNYGEYEFAAEVAWNHIINMEKVFTKFQPDTGRLDAEQPQASGGHLWELYAPESDEPGTRWDTYHYGRPDYVPTAGFGPVAMLIEDVMGFDFDAPSDCLTWRLWLLNEHGIRNLKFGDNLITLWCEKRESPEAPLRIFGTTSSPMQLKLFAYGDSLSMNLPRGRIKLFLQSADFHDSQDEK